MLGLRAVLPRGKQFAVVLGNASRQISLPHNCRCITSASWTKPQQSEPQNFQQNRWLSVRSTKTESEDALQRIYYGTLAPRMKMVKFFSLSTSLAGLAAQPILLEQGMKIGGTGMAVFLCTVGGFFTFVTPLLLHFITKKYVTELHYNPRTEEYTATTISLLLQKIKTTFRPNDVVVPEVPGMFTSFLVNKRPLFVDPALFDDPEHYVKIMGYDKPIDFKLDLTPNMEKSKKSEEQQ
ncbi:transmembrane protein 70 homolog, mitochondrial [Drosophila mauritiana]|uniref:Transmembrane protein 70 homolog, mitochondrial n=1 Tax=Drosophila mauritiana TaxID=7226 RepID=A0A6P8K9G4_DROMA|nr:transmembrane protein 70 homolog, mitochondrial [Drosophila mauritiana]